MGEMGTLPVSPNMATLLTVAIPEDVSQTSKLLSILKAQAEMADLIKEHRVNPDDPDSRTWSMVAEYLTLAADAVTEAEHFITKALAVIAKP